MIARILGKTAAGVSVDNTLFDLLILRKKTRSHLKWGQIFQQAQVQSLPAKNIFPYRCACEILSP